MVENSGKYLIHQESGMPIRISPSLRRELTLGTEVGQIQARMITRSRVIGRRDPQSDCLPQNMVENIRLRKIAHALSVDLVSFAKRWNIDRYCTVVHGSVARGLVRNPLSHDPSDIDIDLVVDSNQISKEERKHVREEMFKRASSYGARVDSYVWTLEEMRRHKGEYARLYLSSSAYPIANTNHLWDEVTWIGIENQRYLSLEGHLKKQFNRLVGLMSQGKIEDVVAQISGESIKALLQTHSLLDFHQTEEVQCKANRLYELFTS